MNKQYLLTALDYLYGLPPSKWNPAVVLRFKKNVLPSLMEIVSGLDEKKETIDIAKEVFEGGEKE